MCNCCLENTPTVILLIQYDNLVVCVYSNPTVYNNSFILYHTKAFTEINDMICIFPSINVLLYFLKRRKCRKHL